MSLRRIDPMQLVKSPMPLLSADRKRAPERALGKLEAAAARDETCVWQRVTARILFCCSQWTGVMSSHVMSSV